MAKASGKAVGIMQLLMQMFSNDSKSIKWLEQVRWAGRRTAALKGGRIAEDFMEIIDAHVARKFDL